MTSLRSEGLPLTQAKSEGDRALGALDTILSDPLGLWLLSPHAEARNESPFLAYSGDQATGLRADRTFLAADSPSLAEGADHLWIVDYKTAELGSRSREKFLADQKRKYLPQMQAYAALAVASGHDPERIRLALYFPLLPALVTWKAASQVACQDVTSM